MNFPPVIRRWIGSRFDELEMQDIRKLLDGSRFAEAKVILVDGSRNVKKALEFCRWVRRHGESRCVPLMIILPENGRDCQLIAFNAGVNDCIVRPLSLPLLKARINNLLQMRSEESNWHDQVFGGVTPTVLGSNDDEDFMRRTLLAVKDNFADCEFTVDVLSRKVAVSRRQFYRKFRHLFGCTPNFLIRNTRLKYAAWLLKKSKMTISEIIFLVGFSDPKYFRSAFRKQFGVLPSEYGG